MLSKKLRNAFERECAYLEYYDKYLRFPNKKIRERLIKHMKISSYE